MVSAICVECTVAPAVAEMVTVVVTDTGLVDTIGGTEFGVAQFTSSKSESSASATITNRRRRLTPAPASISPHRSTPELTPLNRRRPGKDAGTWIELTESSEVWMVSVAATSVPGIVTFAGAKVHVVAAGNPEQESATEPA